MNKKKTVEELYKKFHDHATTDNNADCIDLNGYDVLIERAYNDLQENWSDEHADIFIDAMNKLFNQTDID